VQLPDCYPDGRIITDGILMRLDEDRYWFAQTDGDLHFWFIAAQGIDV